MVDASSAAIFDCDVRRRCSPPMFAADVTPM